MKNKQHHVQLNLSVPNLVNICVDNALGGEFSGRFYHCYSKEPETFSSIVQLIRKIDELFDDISFPQASTKARSFSKKTDSKSPRYTQKVLEQSEIITYSGDLGTFILTVKFRQNSTWQGELYRMEQDKKYSFSNTLDLIKLIDHSIGDLA